MNLTSQSQLALFSGLLNCNCKFRLWVHKHKKFDCAFMQKTIFTVKHGGGSIMLSVTLGLLVASLTNAWPLSQ